MLGSAMMSLCRRVLKYMYKKYESPVEFWYQLKTNFLRPQNAKENDFYITNSKGKDYDICYNVL